MKERTQKILVKLLTATNYLLTKDLSKEFQISERTLRNELMEINLYLEEKQLPEVKNTRGKGLKLHLTDPSKGQLLKMIDRETESEYYTPEERFLALLFDIADTSFRTVLYEKEEVFQVSKSTLDEDMRKLRKFVKRYGISVVSLAKQGMLLQGDERSIRTMLYDVVNQFTDVDHLIECKDPESGTSFSERSVFQAMPIRLFTQIGEIYENVFRKTRLQIDQVYRNQVILFTSIWVCRLRSEKTVSESIKTRTSIKEGLVRTFVNEICMRLNVPASINELNYIAFILESFNPKDMHNSFEWVMAQLSAIKLIDHVESETGIPFSLEEEDLHEGLYKHITGLLSRARNDIQVFNPLKDTIKETYPEIYRAVEIFSSEIEEYTKKRLSEDEIGFLTIYFSTSESRMKQDRQSVFQAVVVCNHGISTGKLLAANLTGQFNIEIVAVLSTLDLEFIEKLDIDLIFSTIPIDYPQKPVLVLTPILRHRDKHEIKFFLEKHQDKRRIVKDETNSTALVQQILRIIGVSGGEVTPEIYREVETAFNEHHLTINKREIKPMLQDILKDSDILLQKDCKDWKEAIIEVAQPLLNEQVIERDYIKAMIQSVEEFGPYIVIGKHIALAHARPENGVNALGVSVMTLEKPVEFGNTDNDPVKIIFCLAAVDSYSHLNIMKNLIELINDEERLDTLILADTIETFNTVLYGGDLGQ